MNMIKTSLFVVMLTTTPVHAGTICNVLGILDGNVAYLSCDGYQISVHLACSVAPRSNIPVYGSDARKAFINYVTNGKNVSWSSGMVGNNPATVPNVPVNVNYDVQAKFTGNKFTGWIFPEGSTTSVNSKMVRNGKSLVDEQYCSIPVMNYAENTKRKNQYRMETFAQTELKGIWKVDGSQQDVTFSLYW